jgi:hypothetical protein
MSRALIVTPEAEADILDGFQSYEEKQAGLGARFLDEIEQYLVMPVVEWKWSGPSSRYKTG